jgi:cell division protein FtsQ
VRWRRRDRSESADIPNPADDSGAVRVLAPGEQHRVPSAEIVSDAALDELRRSFASAPKRTVVIEDDDRPSPMVLADDGSLPDPEPVASRGIDPRIRERRIAVKRLAGRRRLKWVALVAAVVVMVVGVLVVLASPLLSIRTVDVDGAAYVQRFDGDLLDQVVASLDGEPILIADLQGAADRLEESPWVRSARVTMDFPDRVRIEIRERVPLAYFTGTDGRARVIDDEGRVIVVLDGQPIDYVQITGEGPDLGPGASAGSTYRAAAQLVRALPDELRPQVASLGVTPEGELTMELIQGTDVRFGVPDDLQAKLVALVVVLRRQPAGSMNVIDVSTGEPTIQ